MGDLYYEVTSQNWTIGIYKTIEEAIANIEYLGKQKPDRKFVITEVRKEKLCTVTARNAKKLLSKEKEQNL